MLPGFFLGGDSINQVEFSLSHPNQSDAGSNEERSLTAGCANEVVEYKPTYEVFAIPRDRGYRSRVLILFMSRCDFKRFLPLPKLFIFQ
jgi:hypothetical protein